MTPDKFIEVIGIYRRLFEETGVGKRRGPMDGVPGEPPAALMHCHWMLDEIEKMVADGEIEKANRWLGFVQGVLWAEDEYSLNQLRAHVRLAKED